MTEKKKTSFLLSKSTQIEATKNIAESIAFIVAALWAIFVFFARDAPTLKEQSDMSSDLTIDQIIGDKVLVDGAKFAEFLSIALFGSANS